jgi:acyl-CoA thioester hydrolase
MRNDPWRREAGRYPFQLTLDTRFGDMDPNRHLNNSAIARLYEEARVRFHFALRRDHPQVGHPRFLIAHVEIDYLDEGLYPAPVNLGLGVLGVGTTSYRLGVGLFQNGACIGLSDAVMVFRGETGAAKVPDILRAALESYALHA